MLRGAILGFSLLVLEAAAAPTIVVDYPEDGSVFPPEITPPTFLWRDSDKTAAEWRIEVRFADGSPALHAVSRGERLRLGKIDPDCVSETNELPKLTARQAAAHTWLPDRATWETIQRHSTAGPATVTIAGSGSRGRVTIRTSKDPVGAPVLYRDVPLMPTETATGVIQPLAPYAVRLVKWRLRSIGEPQSRVVMESLPVCANCHSFSADGKTLGMDLDGLQNNKGLYMLTHVAPETSIPNENVIQWRSAEGRLTGSLRIGFMSQVSPDGRYVVTTLDRPAPAAGPRDVRSNYYVANFKDYRFLQVFYPTRGILNWYSRAAGVLQPLAGADDPRFVQTGAVWSPDGKYLVFERAEAKEPNPEGAVRAKFANDPNEAQIRYDLYRIPFNDGRGGAPEPIAGASGNGMSNTFPKVSPDGRWIVFVKCRNGLLMRPDSRLWIVPAEGGEAREMRANTRLMNSWHSFSPNGRWLVFSSKSRSPYTQLYLTHIDEQGNDSPAILIDNTTASNRAANIPEFVNVAPEGLRHIGGPALDYYRRFDRALYLQKKARFAEAAAEWRKVVELRGDDAMSRNNLAVSLLLAGRRAEAAPQFQAATELKLRRAVELNPAHAGPHNELGAALLEAGRMDEAIAEFRKATEIDAKFAPAWSNLGGALGRKGMDAEALVEFAKALELDANYAPAHYGLGMVLSRRGDGEGAIRELRKAVENDPGFAEAQMALGAALRARGEFAEALAHWGEAARLRPNDPAPLERTARVLATCPDGRVRNGQEAVAAAARAVQMSGGKDPATLDTLAAAYAEAGRFREAVLTARRALSLIGAGSRPGLSEAIRASIASYEAATPLREP